MDGKWRVVEAEWKGSRREQQEIAGKWYGCVREVNRNPEGGGRKMKWKDNEMEVESGKTIKWKKKRSGKGVVGS